MHRQTDQWDKIKESRNRFIHNQLIYYNGNSEVVCKNLDLFKK